MVAIAKYTETEEFMMRTLLRAGIKSQSVANVFKITKKALYMHLYRTDEHAMVRRRNGAPPEDRFDGRPRITAAQADMFSQAMRRQRFKSLRIKERPAVYVSAPSIAATQTLGGVTAAWE